MEQLTLETPALESPSLGLFSPQNVKRAWLSTKNLHPLLGARFHEQPDASGVDFVVDEAHLNMIASNEIMFTTLRSDEEACSLVDDILNGPRRLSNEQLVQLWIISFPRRSGSSSSTCYQLLLHMAHSIHDGVAQNTIIRVFFDLLVHPSTPEMYIPKGSLESRLMTHLAIDELHPSLKLSPARQRWRLAIARVMYSRKEAAWRVSTDYRSPIMKTVHIFCYSSQTGRPHSSPHSYTAHSADPSDISNFKTPDFKGAQSTCSQDMSTIRDHIRQRTPSPISTCPRQSFASSLCSGSTL